jgi:ech hydrogenase subunit B
MIAAPMLTATDILIAIVAVIIAPLAGGLLYGIDRKVSARLQNRMGPPIEQPFYDFLKLWAKSRVVANKAQLVYVYLYLVAVVASLFLLFLRQDMIMIIVVLAVGSVSFIMGGFSVKSPYTQIGSQREIIQLMAYEPVLILTVFAAYGITGSFTVDSILKYPQPLLFALPLVLLAMLTVLGIKLRKSPFDLSASGHAHQELVRGILTEYSGRYLALIEMVHWYELILVLGFIALFWATNLIVGAAIALFCYFLMVVMDNIAARMTWSWMVKFTWSVGIGLIAVNLVFLWARTVLRF